MALEHAQTLQNTFLNHLRAKNIPVTMFLANGVKLQGYITAFDNFSIQLTRAGSSQLVYKHAISAINPGEPIQLNDHAERNSGL